MNVLCDAVYLGLFLVLLLALLRAVLRKTWLTVLVTLLLLCPMYMPKSAHPAVSWLTFGIAGIALAIWVIMRFGLLTITTGLLVLALLTQLPLTLDFRMWYADVSLLALTISIGVALFGFYNSRTGRPTLQV